MGSKLVLFHIFFLSLFIYLFQSLVTADVTCEAGGPYAKNRSTNITLITIGNVTNPTGVANVTVNITRGSTKNAEQNVTADQQGYYSSAINASLDVGTYTIFVREERGGVLNYCNDTITVSLLEIEKCVDKVITISGISTYVSSGQPLTSGRVTASVIETRIVNTTSFSSNSFNISMSGCFDIGKRYLVQIASQDQTNKIGYAYIIITG